MAAEAYPQINTSNRSMEKCTKTYSVAPGRGLSS